MDLHCIRGELLFNQTHRLKPLAKIIRNHHKHWCEIDCTLSEPDIFAAQLILLSDLVERLIDKNKYILHQTKDIIERVEALKDITVNADLIAAFLETAKREEFWLDIMSPRLYPLLLHNGPLRHIELDLEGISTIAELFMSIIDFKSRYTATHTSGVAACAEKMSELFGFTNIEIALMRIAGCFHDIGKLVIPNSILEKPDKLSPNEFAVIKCHTYYTYYVLNSIGGLQPIAKWAAYHHEKLDGSGYPFHCKEQELDNGARIMAVADIFTAIAEDRPYRVGMHKDAIYQVLKDQSESNYIDPRFVNLLFDNYDTIYNYVAEKQSAAKAFYEGRF
jgi:HD-GYP domain-containing protein (c-di-GMP phosphodiesterase class II)